MRLSSLFIVLALLAGCAQRGDPYAVAGTTTTIAVGQPWPQGRAVALRAGYALHDASQLAMAPTPDGFYIDMSGGRGLLVFRDPRRDVVESIEWVENWNGPKASRIYHEVKTFDVPPADSAVR